MTETERSILDELIHLDQLVKSMPTAQPKPSLLASFAKLEALSRELPPSGDAALRHYLDRKSYEKARLHLEGLGSKSTRDAH